MADVIATLAMKIESIGAQQARAQLAAVKREAQATATGTATAAASMEGSLSGVTRAASLLGTALGFGLVTAITSAVSFGVQRYQDMQRSIDDARKAQERLNAEIGKSVNSGDSTGLQRQLQEKLRGQFDAKSGRFAPVFDAGENRFTTGLETIDRTIALLKSRGLDRGLFGGLALSIEEATAKSQQLRREITQLAKAIMDPTASGLLGSGGMLGTVTVTDNQRAPKGSVAAALIQSLRPPAGIARPVARRAVEFGTAGAPGSNPFGSPDESPFVLAAQQQINALNDMVSAGLAAALSNGLASGFAAAVQSGSIKDGFGALARGLLAGLGGLMQALGQRMLAIAVTMSEFWKLVIANPAAAAGVALGLIAWGGALQGLAGRSFGQGNVPVGAGPGANSSPTTIIDRGTIAGPTSTMGASGASSSAGAFAGANITILSPQDPTWLRQLSESMKGVAARGG